MRELTLGRTLLYAIFAGLLAGVLVTAFHFVITEPVIDRAIALEEANAAQEQAADPGHSHAEETPIVSRDFQKTGGLLLGYLLYGLTWSLFFSLVFFPLQGWLMRLGAWRGAALLAALAWWAIIVVPFIKYPANPPAVGDPETIGYRQSLYITMLLLSVGGTALVVRLSGGFAQQLRQPRWLVASAGLLLVGVLLILVLPNNPDAVTAPMELIDNFRVRSIIGLTLFWVIFGTTFGWLTQRAMQRTPARAVAALG
jgi:predicted cobalt transporter CbtA